jgi:hypothetical protein
MSRRRRLLAMGGGYSIAPGYVDLSRITWARAQDGAQSTSLGPDGLETQFYGADVPRFNGVPRLALIEGQRTNVTPNPWMVGAVPGVIGSGGALPTGFAIDAAAGLTRTVVGTGTMHGRRYLDLRLNGTTATTAFFVLRFQAPVSALEGETWTQQLFLALAGGSLANITSTVVSLRAAGGTVSPSEATFPALAADVWAMRRVSGVVGAGVSSIAAGMAFFAPLSSAIDVTFRIALGNLEQAPFASTLILPAIDTIAASTRGADLVTATLASLGIGDNGACTVLGTFRLPQSAPSGAPQVLWQMDAGGPSNRWTLTNPGGTTFLQLVRVTADVAAGASAAAFTPGAIVRVGVSINGSGGGSMSFNGASAVGVGGGPTSGLTTKRLGNRDDGAAPLNGEIGWLQILPYAVSDAELQARVAALPLT